VKTVYIGTSAFAAEVLATASPNLNAVLALTRPPSAKGRGRRVSRSPVAQRAQELGIAVAEPLRLEDAAEQIAALEPDAVVLCAYGAMVREPLLSRYEILNVHPSLLPRWRGAAPVERAILAGDQSTGVTIHRTVAELDAGPIAAQEAFAIGELDAGAVYERSAEVATRLLDQVLRDGPQFTPQAEAGATYAEKITAADRELDLSDPEAALRRIRALSPHIGAWAELHGRRVTIWRAHLEDGRLVPDEVQPEGRRRMSYDELVRGLR
jgi:methionyl-tRNA formyltransferase